MNCDNSADNTGKVYNDGIKKAVSENSLAKHMAVYTLLSYLQRIPELLTFQCTAVMLA